MKHIPHLLRILTISSTSLLVSFLPGVASGQTADPATADLALSTISVSSTSVSTDVGTVDVTVQIRDEQGNSMDTADGDTIEVLGTFDTEAIVIEMTYQGTGEYTGTLTNTTVGEVVISASLNGGEITSSNPTVTFTGPTISVTQDDRTPILSGATVNFSTSVDTPLSTTLIITASNATLELGSFEITSSGATTPFTIEGNTPTTIDSGDSASLVVNFSGTTNAEETLSFTTNDSDAPEFTINLSGTATSSSLSVTDPGGTRLSNNTPAQFSYVSPSTGDYEDKTIKIQNYGNAAVTIASIVSDNTEFQILDFDGEFELDAADVTGDVTVPTETSFTLRFQPQDTRRDIQATVTITEEGSENVIYSFLANGDSAPTPDGEPDEFGYYFLSNLPTSTATLVAGEDGVSSLDLTVDDAQPINFNFDFKFYDNSYETCSVSPDGLILFDAIEGAHPTPHNLPKEGSSSTNLIAPFWSSLDPTGAQILYRTSGSSPNRICTIQWTDFKDAAGDNASNITFQVLLFERTSEIQFHYLALDGITSTGTPLAIGIQNLTGSAGLGYFYGLQNGSPATGYFSDSFPTAPSVVGFKRPVRASVISTFLGRPNDGTRVTCTSTKGLETGMYLSTAGEDGGLLRPQTTVSDTPTDIFVEGQGDYPIIQEILDETTFIVDRPAAISVGGLSFTVTNYDPETPPTAVAVEETQPSFTPIVATYTDDLPTAAVYRAGENGADDADGDGDPDSTRGIDYEFKWWNTNQGINALNAVGNYDMHVNNTGVDGLAPGKGSQVGILAENVGIDFASDGRGNTIGTENDPFPLAEGSWSARNDFSYRFNGYLDMRGFAPGKYNILLGADDTNKFVINTDKGTYSVAYDYDNVEERILEFEFETPGLFPFDNVFAERGGAEWVDIGIQGADDSTRGTGGIAAKFVLGTNPYSGETLIGPPVFPIDIYPSDAVSNVTIALSDCATDSDPSADMLSATASNDASDEPDLGYSINPGATYAFERGQQVTFEAPEYIYFNSQWEILSGPGDAVDFDPENLGSDASLEVATYRLSNQGYAVDGQVIQGTDQVITQALTDDVTVEWQWKLQYAVFLSDNTALGGRTVDIQGGVGDPDPVRGVHWIDENGVFNANISRVSGTDSLNTDTGGFRYEVSGYSVNTVDPDQDRELDTDYPRTTQTTTFEPESDAEVDTSNTGALVAIEPLIVTDWSTVTWTMKGQVRYRFKAFGSADDSASATFLNQAFVEVTSIPYTIVYVDDPSAELEIPFAFDSAGNLVVTNVSAGETLAEGTNQDYTVEVDGSSGTLRLVDYDGASDGALIRISDPTAAETQSTVYNTGSLQEVWVNIGDAITIGAYYRTEDRCYTLTDFVGTLGGDLSSLSSSISAWEDLESYGENGRLARVHYIASASAPTEVDFEYKPTVFRAEIPLGSAFDPASPNTYLVPQLCEDAQLRAGTSGFDLVNTVAAPESELVGETPIRWDQVDYLAYPVQPGIYELEWPDANDPGTSYKIQIVTGYPGDTVVLPSAREVLLEDDSGNSKRQTVTVNSGYPVPGSDTLFYLRSIELARVSEDFPGSSSVSGEDAHYRHLVYPSNNSRTPPSRLDPLTTDQWSFVERTYADTSADPNIDSATEGIGFTPDGEGRCVLLYSLRPNPDEVATGDLTRESLVVRVIRCEEKTSLLRDDPKLVLGRRSLLLDDANDLTLTDAASIITLNEASLNEGFVMDFWLNAKGLRSDDGDVIIFETTDDNLKVTLTNSLSSTSSVLQTETDSIAIPFASSTSGDLVVTNVSTGETLEVGTDYEFQADEASGTPFGAVSLTDTDSSTIGDQIRIDLADPVDAGSQIILTYQGVEVAHAFSTAGSNWSHYAIHVFPYDGLGLEGRQQTFVQFYQDGIQEQQVVQSSSVGSEVKIERNSLRFGVGADPDRNLKLDQFRIFDGVGNDLDDTEALNFPSLSIAELTALRTERESPLRGVVADLWFSFDYDSVADGPGSGSFLSENENFEIRPADGLPFDDTGDYLGYWAHNNVEEVATRIYSTLDTAGFSGGGYVLNEVSNYNAQIYDRGAQVGSWGPLYPVNDGQLYTDAEKRLEVAYYENPFLGDARSHPNVAWPYEAAAYDEVVYPTYGPHSRKAIYIASRLGSEGVDQDGKVQQVYDLENYANLAIYNQPDETFAGYNPNEEHALAAGSNRAALKIKAVDTDLPNNPPLAAFALQNDINGLETSYTSAPWVLTQVRNLATGEEEMAAYQVFKQRVGTIDFPRPSDAAVLADPGLQYESAENPEDRFLTYDPEASLDFTYAFDYSVTAGDLLIPPYPLNLVIGNTVMEDSRGGNNTAQQTLWEDVNGSNWVVSGGGGTFYYQYFYPFRGDFYPPGGATLSAGTPVAWVPKADVGSPTFTGLPGDELDPGEVIYTSEWGSDYPKLKRGETLTYQGGEYFNENTNADGLPALVAMAAAEVVFDSETPTMIITDDNLEDYSARIIRPLDRYEYEFSTAAMEEAGFSPAASSITVVAERWYFTDLAGSLQSRFYFDSLAEKLVFRGYLNEKDSGDPDLTAGPDPLNILEPNVLSEEDRQVLKDLDSATNSDWDTAVETIYELSRNPLEVRDETRFNENYPTKDDAYLAGMRESLLATDRMDGIADSTVEELARLRGELSDKEKKLRREARKIRNRRVIRRWTGPLRAVSRIERNISDLTAEITALEATVEPVYDHLDSFGVGSALITNPALLLKPADETYYITIAENNRTELDGAAVSLHIIEIIPDRYRGALKVIEGPNAFSEQITIQHNGEFGGNTDDLYYEWWIRDATALDVVADEVLDDGTLSEVDSEGNSLWQQYIPQSRATLDSDVDQHRGLHSIVFEGRPDVTLADKLVLMRYRHVDESGWNLVPLDFTDAAAEWDPGTPTTETLADGTQKDTYPGPAPFQWAGAANSPQLQADGSKRYIPQLVMGWVKRILDRINPYEARYTDFFSNESPALYSSQIQIAGAPYAGAVALNPDKNVIENTGLIELYETVLARAKDLTIDNSSNAVSTDGINQAILLAATRLAVLYELLGREAYSDAQDSTITVTEDSGLSQVAAFTHSFQNMEASLQHEELALLRGTDFLKSYPVYNRLFWNYTKGLGEAAYNVNYNIHDDNGDGFINEDDGRAFYPQGHGDAWGHLLSALGMHYELLQQPVFQWNARSELYSLMENVLEVDYLDEKTFAKLAASKAQAGVDIVRGTYRLHYTQDPDGQWQGYTDGADPARAWGVSEWAHRAGQGALFDWAIANALLPAEAEDAAIVENPENLDRLERSIATDEISLITSGLVEIQGALNEANQGVNPLGFDSGALTFDLNPEFYENASGGDPLSHFEQVYGRALTAAANASATLAFATQAQQKLRSLGDDTDALVLAALEQDLDFRGSLIEIFGRPYDGQIGFGKAYPEGYLGPDTLLYAYLDRNDIAGIIPDGETSTDPARITFEDIRRPMRNIADEPGVEGWFSVGGNEIFNELAIVGGIALDVFAAPVNPTRITAGGLTGNELVPFDGGNSDLLRNAVQTFVEGNAYLDVETMDLDLPVQRASDYSFVADSSWGQRLSYGLLQQTLEEMLAEEIALRETSEQYKGFLGDLETIVVSLLHEIDRMRDRGLIGDVSQGLNAAVDTLLVLKTLLAATFEDTAELAKGIGEAAAEAPPSSVGFSVDAGSGFRAAIKGISETAATVVLQAKTLLEFAADSVDLVRDQVIAEFERDLGRIDNQATIEGALAEFENLSGSNGPLLAQLGGHLQRLEILRQTYFTHLNTGFSLLRKREAFNKVLAASVQENRYEDMIFRLTRNEAMGKYQTAFNHAARYTWLAAKAYDYETSLDPGNPAAPGTLLDQIVKERQLGLWVDGEPQVGQGGLAEILATLQANFGVLKGQLGLRAPQSATEKLSLRSELFRIGSEEDSSDERWAEALKARCVEDLNALPEFRRYCRPFETTSGDAQPGLVIEFSSHIEPGLNFFGRPLGPGDHSYSTANFATKIRAMGVWMENYNSAGLSTTPRAYLVPVGTDFLRTSSENEPEVRAWDIVEQRIPVPYVINGADLTAPGFVPTLDGVDGSFSDLRRHGDFRIYHDDGNAEADDSEMEYDSRLIGRSVWNSRWLLIIPGAGLLGDATEGLSTLTDTISDIKIHFSTYSHQGQ